VIEKKKKKWVVSRTEEEDKHWEQQQQAYGVRVMRVITSWRRHRWEHKHKVRGDKKHSETEQS